MNRRGFLKTLAAGSVMVMLPSLAESLVSNSSLNTVEDLTAWIETKYKCYMGEARAFMLLDEAGLKKYDLSLNDLPIENKVFDIDEDKPVAIRFAYSTVAYAIEGSNPVEAERQLVTALKEKFEQEAPAQKLIWRLKPEFTSDKMTEYGETWANREAIEDGLRAHLTMPDDVEYDFDSDSYKYVKRRYVLNKLRMRLVFPEQIAEDYNELTIEDGGRPKRI